MQIHGKKLGSLLRQNAEVRLPLSDCCCTNSRPMRRFQSPSRSHPNRAQDKLRLNYSTQIKRVPSKETILITSNYLPNHPFRSCHVLRDFHAKCAAIKVHIQSREARLQILAIIRLVEKSRFWGCLMSTLKSIFGLKSRLKSIKKALWLPNFKGRL